MGFFDRLANLGKGWVSTKTRGGERDCASELAAAETERAADGAPATASRPAAATPDSSEEKAPPASSESTSSDDEPGFDEPRERVKKTL